MPPPTPKDVLAARKGLVIAPAGCGKTQLIVDSVRAHVDRPALVLTHTNAGVAALRERLRKHAVPAGAYHLRTLDGFALRLVRCYPARCEITVDLAANLGPQYRGIRSGCARLLERGAIDELVNATYGRVLIDEYQDCSAAQHAIALALARTLPVCVFADSLQAIFGFGGDPLPAWEKVVAGFPLIGELSEPWRWRNAGTGGFGDWLSSARQALQQREGIDLTTGDPWVRWRQIGPDEGKNIRARLGVLKPFPASESVVVIGHATTAASRHKYARLAPGTVIVEPVEMGDLVKHALAINEEPGRDSAAVAFAKEVMTGVTGPRVRAALAAAGKQAGMGVSTVGVFLRALQGSGCRVFRHALLHAMLAAIAAEPDHGGDLAGAAISVREALRHRGRRLPRRAVGSTLLLKGLEADHAIILDSDAMDRRHLYVALTRAAKSVTVFSRQAVVTPPD